MARLSPSVRAEQRTSFDTRAAWCLHHLTHMTMYILYHLIRRARCRRIVGYLSGRMMMVAMVGSLSLMTSGCSLFGGGEGDRQPLGNSRQTCNGEQSNSNQGPSTADFYVATNGSDSNPGTEVQPFRTIDRALSAMNAGQTTFIRAGHYFEQLDINSGGTSGQPITLQGYPGEEDDVVISAGAFVIDNGQPVPAFKQGMNNLNVSNAAQGIYCADNNVQWVDTSGFNVAFVEVLPGYPNERLEAIVYESNADFSGNDLGSSNGSSGYIGPGTFGDCIRLHKNSAIHHFEQRNGQIFNNELPDPNNYTIHWSKADYTMRIAANHVTLRNLTLSASKRTLLLRSNNITLDGVTVWSGTANGIHGTGADVHDILIVNSRVYGDSIDWMFWTDAKVTGIADKHRGTAIAMYDQAHHWEIFRSHIRGQHDLIGMNKDNHNLIVHESRIERCADDGFELEGTSSGIIGYTEIYDNIIANCLTLVSYAQDTASGSGPFYFYNNIGLQLSNPAINRAVGQVGWNGGWHFGYEYAMKNSYDEAENSHVINNLFVMLNSDSGSRIIAGDRGSATAVNNILVHVNGEVLDSSSTGGANVGGNLCHQMNPLGADPPPTEICAHNDDPLFVADLMRGNSSTTSTPYNPNASGSQSGHWGEMNNNNHFVLDPQVEYADASDFLVQMASEACDGGVARPSGFPNNSMFAQFDSGTPDIGPLPCAIPAEELDVWPFSATGPRCETTGN